VWGFDGFDQILASKVLWLCGVPLVLSAMIGEDEASGPEGGSEMGKD